MVLTHTCWHPPLLSRHSSTSVQMKKKRERKSAMAAWWVSGPLDSTDTSSWSGDIFPFDHFPTACIHDRKSKEYFRHFSKQSVWLGPHLALDYIGESIPHFWHQCKRCITVIRKANSIFCLSALTVSKWNPEKSKITITIPLHSSLSGMNEGSSSF